MLDPGDPLQFVKELQVWSLTARLRLGRLWEPPGEPVLSLSKGTRMPGGVGAGGENPPATRLGKPPDAWAYRCLSAEATCYLDPTMS